MGETDDTLVRRVLTGDRNAFEVLVNRYKGTVYALAAGRVGFDAAEDLVQSAFVEAYLNLRSLKDPAKFSAWLRTIATNLSRKWARRRRPTIPLDSTDREGETAVHEEILAGAHVSLPQAPEALHEREVVRAHVLDAVERLPAKYREAVLLHYMEE